MTVQITDSEPCAGHEPLTNDIYQMSIALADGWNDKKGGASNDMCAALFVNDTLAGPITESATEAAFSDGHLDFVGTERYEALDDLWGAGLFNLKNIDWRADPSFGPQTGNRRQRA
ncbi:MAG: hypothetical protein ACLFVJ_02925 [Persicimonas sp.]